MTTTLCDILITGGIVVTMDPQRRVLEDGTVAISNGRLVAVGATPDVMAMYQGRQVVDAQRKAVLPGLIDGHGHAGHGLVQTLGGGNSAQWYAACATIYAEGSTEEFWYAASS